jgi:hypothetical protein
VIAGAKMQAAIALAREARANQQGRDPEAAEAYVGMACVLPVAQGFFGLTQPDKEEPLRATTDRLKALVDALGEAEKVAPALEGLHLWADSLSACGGPRVPRTLQRAKLAQAGEPMRDEKCEAR